MTLAVVASRFLGSAVAWTWMLNLLRVSSSFLLLPLLIRLLPTPEFGMFWVFTGLYLILPILDFGFSHTLGRSIGYAMGGAESLQPMGLAVTTTKEPNWRLLCQLIFATRRLYTWLALGTALLLGIGGSVVVGLRIEETSSPTLTWIAWFVMVLAATLELYLGWWTLFLRSTDRVLQAARLSVLGYGINLALAAGLLLSGVGLLSVPFAILVSSSIQRILARRECLRLVPQAELRVAADFDVKALVRTLWPNTWRVGVLLLGNYITANLIIFLPRFGLGANAEYGLTLRVFTLAASISSAWTDVKWPIVAQLRAQRRFNEILDILRLRFRFQLGTYMALALIAIAAGPPLIQWLSPDKQMLPMAMLVLLSINAFFQLQFGFWTTLLATENRIPSFWPTVVTNIASLALTVLLLRFTSLRIEAVVAPPLAMGLLFNYWYWAIEGAKSLRTTLVRFLFSADNHRLH